MSRAAVIAACLALAACLGLASCEAPTVPPPPPSSTGPLDPTTVARVADIAITADQVTRIAAAQHVAPAQARDLAVRDARFAAEAQARGIDTQRDVDLAANALLARLLVQDITAAAEAEGPVTDAELDAITERHWTELDRPDAARTIHAVVLLKNDTSADARAKAAAVASEIGRAVTPVSEVASSTEPPKDPRGPEDLAAAAFRKAATSVASPALEVRVELLPPVVPDGRTLQGGTPLDEKFARAAVALTRRGDISPVIETSFGYHVLLLLEHIPGHIVPREERRAMVREEALSTRARRQKDKLLEGLRPGAAIGRSADAILALVPVDR